MTKEDARRWLSFTMDLGRENGTEGKRWNDYNTNELKRLNSRLHTLAERSCNGDGWYSRSWNDQDEKRFQTSCASAMAKVRAIFEKYGDFEVEEQGDPRGWGMFEATSKKTGRKFRIDW